MFELDPVEVRILGCLLEKERITPDAYPLTLNALRLACNQATNRDPVTTYDEPTIHEALARLHRRELTRVTGSASSRVTKYRHLLNEQLGLQADEAALVCVLLLRGEQTPGELKQRSERLHAFPDLAAVDTTMARLEDAGLVQRLERQPGEKQVRYRHLLGAGPAGSGGDSGADDPAVAAAGEDTAPSQLAVLAEAIDDLRAAVADLRHRLDAVAPDPTDQDPVDRG